MSNILYFAYGSNMLTTRLQRWCKTAEYKSLAMIKGHRVAFYKKSVDSSGKATLVTCDSKVPVLGAVFEISISEIDELDAAEGAGYERQDEFPVICLQTGELVQACTYVALENVSDLRPFDWYLALVLAGLHSHDMDREYIQAIESTDFTVDTSQHRKSRVDAIRDLQAAGYSDYSVILRNSAKAE